MAHRRLSTLGWSTTLGINMLEAALTAYAEREAVFDEELNRA
jgi:hypothetical protein